LGFSDALGLMTHARIEIIDEVSDNCWTNANKIRATSELSLIQNDIVPLEYQPYFYHVFSPIIRIYAVGFRNASMCSGYIALTVQVNAESNIGGGGGSERFQIAMQGVLFERGSLATNGNNLNDHFDEFVQTAMAELIRTHLVAKRNEDVQRVWNQMSNLRQKPLSREEVLRQIEN
jgi:hypothetical protein